MSIHFDTERQFFHLQSKNTSYVMQVINGDYLTHLYWGAKIKSYNHSNPLLFIDRGFSSNPTPLDL
ncbi:hypothetical protein ACP8HI_06815 [Paenibacillus sp. FA6]|uniref:hypothetical protein n=1 Tax=Paenibacillus sp. FA6 TaxID=3413029 RepID=UPI003F655545